MGMDNFGHLNSSLSLFYFFFVTNLQNKLWRTYAYSWTSPHPYTSQYAFSWTTSSPSSVSALWMTQKSTSGLKQKKNVIISIELSIFEIV